MKKFANLFVSIVFIAGALSACNQQEVDDLKSQMEEMKSNQIASISTQISSIQASITSLEKIDAELKARIETLESSDESQAQEISDLKEAEASLSQRITELKTYVDDELKKQKDWVSATFSTLEQYQSTCEEIAIIKQNLSTLETTLRGLISDTETSIKSWVNEQLTGYYTIAEMNAKISVLEKAITDGDEAEAEELGKLRTDLETAKTEIKTAYEKAISDAITTSEGKINEKIAADIKTATDALQSQIDEINTKITDIETRLGLIEESLEKILARVQSIVVVPTYSDGSVRLKDCEDTEILFEVMPRSAAVALAQQGIEVFSLEAVSTETKSSMFVAQFPIKSVKDNGECLVVTLDSGNLDKEAINNYPSMSARLKIDDGSNSLTSGYFSLDFEGHHYTLQKEYTFNLSAINVDVDVSWKAGDRVYLSDGKDTEICTIPDEYDGNSTAMVMSKKLFSGEVIAIYPAELVTQDEGTFYVDIPEDQGDNPSKYIVYSGSTTDGNDNITLSNKTALVTFSIFSKNDKLSYAKHTFTGSPVVGRMKIDANGTSVVSGTQSVRLSLAGNGDYYFPVLPCSITKVISKYQRSKTTFYRVVGSMNRNVSPNIIVGFGKFDVTSHIFTEAADLGLSVCWSLLNFGGTSTVDYDYGDYYAWGETNSKEDYSWSTYAFELGTDETGPFSKYVIDSSYGTVDNKTVLDSEDDVINVKAGYGWRMPTEAEWRELMDTDNCSWTWTSTSGVKGYLVESKKSGYEGNSIFLPAAGSYYNTSLRNAGSVGEYWSSSSSDSFYLYGAWGLNFTSSYVSLDPTTYRCIGLSIRGVIE